MTTAESTAIRAVIAEDEPLQRALLRTLLGDERDLVVVAEAGDGEAAVAAIRAHRPDLLFLDVQMPGLDAFGVIEEIGIEQMPATIFVTAYDAYAVRAFEVHAVDYLLKPFDGERLGRAVRHAVGHIRRGAPAGDRARLRELLMALRREDAPTRLAIRTDGRVRFVELATIHWIEAAGKNVRVHTAGEVHEYRETMSNLEQQLDPRQFIRVHRSAIVAIPHVREVQSWFGGEFVLILRDGKKVTTGRAYRDAVAKLTGGARP